MLRPGTYKVSGKARHTRGETEITVGKNGAGEYELPLNTGALNLAIFESAGKPFEKGKYTASMAPLDAAGKTDRKRRILLGSGYSNPIVVPPGRYRISARSGGVEVVREIDLPLGKPVALDLVLSSGVVRILPVDAAGAAIQKSGNVWIEILPLDEAGKPGKRITQNAYNRAVGQPVAFRLSPGRYRASSKFTGTASTIDFEIAEGKMFDLKLPMK
jgi:hypothetical protein